MNVRRVVLGMLAISVGAAVNVGIAWWSAWRGVIGATPTTYMTWSHKKQASVQTIVVEFVSPTSIRRTANIHLGIPGISSFPVFLFQPWFTVNTPHELGEVTPIPGAVSNYLDPQVLNAAVNPPPDKLFGRSPVLDSTPIDDLHGWPMLSLRSSLDATIPNASVVARGILLETAPPGSSPGVLVTDHRALPLTVIPRGFAVNTMFYATLVSVPAGLFTTIRAIRRRGQRLCPACGYDLRGQPQPGCPECGAGRVAG